MNISSVVVSTKPKDTKKVIDKLKKIDGVDYHMHDELGRVIVTIEAIDVSEEIKILKKIEKTEHVISADMSYTYAKDELEKERALIGKSDDKILEKLDEDANKTIYTGSIYNFLGDKEKKEK